jgi:GNAT superfamily N-acetyltransferase
VLKTASCEEAGLLELDFREAGQCEIAFFGLIPSAIGKGLGSFLMREAIARAWREPIKRLWVHTCTLDHPSALAFYRRQGFRPYRQQIEVADDPRVLEELPATAAAHVPIFAP